MKRKVQVTTKSAYTKPKSETVEAQTGKAVSCKNLPRCFATGQIQSAIGGPSWIRLLTTSGFDMFSSNYTNG